MKYYAIKRPDGSWIMRAYSSKAHAWGFGARGGDTGLMKIAGYGAMTREKINEAAALGYRCVEVSGFVEVKP